MLYGDHMSGRKACTILATCLLFAACEDSPTDTPRAGEEVRLRVEANLSATAATVLVVEVTGADIDPPLIFNIDVVDGVASGTVSVPVGSARTFMLRAYDSEGIETHRASTTVDIRYGTNPAINLTLLPLSGDQPISVAIGTIVITITPQFDTVGVGRTVQLTATVTDSDNNEVPGYVHWAVLDASKARIDSAGVVTGLEVGTVEVVAVFGHIAATAQIVVMEYSDYVESLIAGAFSLWLQVHDYSGPTMFLSVASGEHVAPWSNAGMEYYARIPRVPSANDAGGRDVGNLTDAWTQAYRALAAVHDGLKQIADGAVDLGEDELRARAFGKFMQGLAHGTVALLYDSGFVNDESIDPAEEEVLLQGYSAVMTAALGYLDSAITLASGATFTVPATWMSQVVSATTLVQLAHSWSARFRANVARTPAERSTVDWNAVVADVNAGITQDWDIVSRCWDVFCEKAIYYRLYLGWQMQNNWVAGMADVSDAYQAWINTPLIDKLPFIIITPDTRWPQGPDEATQLDNPGEYYTMNTEGSSRIWSRPNDGVWRWSYYYQTYEPFFSFTVNNMGDLPQVTVREMKALVAEKAYIDGDMAAVAAFVNETRDLHGLAETDATGTNTDCVPRLPNGNCGDLWEMFKWEKRLETQFAGPLRSGWYLDGRGWGDLMEGTILQFPVPYSEMLLLGQPPYNFGGVGGDWGAPVGTYGY